MKKIILIICYIFISNSGLFSQNNGFYKIYGHVIDRTTKKGLTNVFVKLSALKNEYKTTTDSLGFFFIDSIPNEVLKLYFQIERNDYYSLNKKLEYASNPHDTLFDFELNRILYSIKWLPEIYFKDESFKPDSNFKEAILQITNFLKSDTSLSLSIIGFKDSSETKDLRLERALFVFNMLIKNGIDKSRLKTEISELPNFLKPQEMYKKENSNKFEYTFLTEEYILKSPIHKRNSLRKLNRCVSFKILN